MARIVCIGEGMLELSREGEGWRLSYGGDTLNTAVHLARTGHEVAFLTALGADAFSRRLRKQWEAEGLDCRLVLTHRQRQAGLYAITTDATGERSFAYWRDSSAAREMFTIPGSDAALELAVHAELVYFSLITLAILPQAGRAQVLSLANRIRSGGGKVAFDANYRPQLWPSPQQARVARDAAISVSDIGLPTADDEAALSGEQGADAVASHWRDLGCAETIVKLGANGCRLPNGEILRPARRLQPVDTSGAGDAFNAGYLGARVAGVSPREAAIAGDTLAAWTIMRPGALPPGPPLFSDERPTYGRP